MRNAIVIGASMGGLLAARALADSFEQVTVLERDSFPPAGENRKGVPQGRHAHALLARGREILEDFFPGLMAELESAGALIGDVAERGVWFNEGGYHCHHVSGLVAVCISRPLLEARVRQRLLALPQVRIIENCDVLGLSASADRSRVEGVRIIRRSAGSAEEILRAELVVDASGRGSRSPAWLEALGYSKAEEEQVRVGVGYASRIYRRDPKSVNGMRAVVIAASPETPRSGVMLAMEGKRWIVTMAGYQGDHPPLDDEGFVEFARSLPAQEIYEVIRQAEPLSEPAPFKYPANQRRRYERLERFPQGYLVFGDAICSFNPIYGQGMTVAALEAHALQNCLAQGDRDLARRFFKAAIAAVDIPWSIAVGNDQRLPGVEMPESRMTRMINGYMARLHVAARRDPVVSRAFLRVANLVAPPPSVMSPGIMLRVLIGNLLQPAAHSHPQRLPARRQPASASD